MIKQFDIRLSKNAEKLLEIQMPSYKVEAEIIGYDDIPPLKDTVNTLKQCGETFFGYYINEELCAAISVKVIDNEVDIHRLIVHPDHFRKGIAQKLLTFIERQFDKRIIIVATGSKNKPAITLYKKNGFRITKEVQVNEHLSLTYFEKKLLSD
ncbi:GNAT family N-acetyltransferase [Solibacillus isronensis]|uniref:GNAT family N-acetyltransferase n=1 Tax=Solibacillus isronensis TaxID=412383 RepID=UPI0009A60422|nr:GNAT family N-acetyltransferase [Solibacillus isronensis]